MAAIRATSATKPATTPPAIAPVFLDDLSTPASEGEEAEEVADVVVRLSVEDSEAEDLTAIPSWNLNNGYER